MSRMVSWGFETGSTTAGMEMSAFTGAGTLDTTVKRSGGYSYKVASLTSATQMAARYSVLSSVSTAARFYRFYLRVDTLPSAANRIITLLSAGGTFATSAHIVYITLDNSGLLRLFDEDGQIGSASSALSTGIFYRIEIEFNASGSAGSHIVKARIDGSEFAAATNRSLSIGNLGFAVGGNLAAEAQTTGVWYFDDIAVNDGATSVNNSYPGEGSVIHVRPNATGDNGDWTGDYTAIDEVTPNDATDAISSNTANHIEDVNLENMPTGVASVNAVAVCARIRGAAASANSSFVYRIKDSSGGTVEESAAITPPNATWATNTTAIIKNPTLVLTDLPGASTSPWTEALLNTAQIGVKISSGNTNAVEVSALWLNIDYVPSVGVTRRKMMLI